MLSPRPWYSRRCVSLVAMLMLGATFTFGMPNPTQAQEEATAEDSTSTQNWLSQFEWRSIGPANMSGRITSIAVYEADPCIWWAATASGGLLKTVNNGITFEHQFDRESTVSIGDVQVFQGDPNIVWVGTGEANPRNSVSWGNGVYRSTDGGESWTHLGLDETFQTGRIALHPTDPNVAYVGSLGRLWGENEERGLFKTTDAGETWEKVLFINDMTGVIDVKMHPAEPDTLLVATYERKRDGFDGNDPEKKYGEGSGVYRTTDGGATFTKMTEGLPTVKMGRIGLDWYRADPNIVYALIESEKIGQEPDDLAYLGITSEDADVGARLTSVVEGSPAAEAGLLENDIIVKLNGETIQSSEHLLGMLNEMASGDEITIEVSRERMAIEIAATLGNRADVAQAPSGGGRGGRGNRNRFTGTLGGQAANLQNQQGRNGFEYGGTYMSRDAGVSWERINTLNPRPMYYSQIRVDPSDNQHIFVLGTSLHRSSDGGATFTPDGGSDGIHVDHHAMWIDPNDGRHMILGNDGGIYVTHDRMTHWDHLAHVAIGQFYHVGVDSTLNYRVYGGLQDNGSWGGPSRVRDGSGPVNSDWFRVGGGDGFICLVDPEDPNMIYAESQNGAMNRYHLVTGERGSIRPRAPEGTRYRFNWKTPFILSPHNSQIHYSAGNHVFRSISRGNGVRAISPAITNTDRGAGSAISESAVDEGVIYVGTTDGALWMTPDGGITWIDLFENPQDVPDTEAPQGGRGGQGNTQRVGRGQTTGTEGRQPSRPASDDGSSAATESSPEETSTDTEAEANSEASQDATPPRRNRNGQRLLDALMQQDANSDGKIQKSELSEQFLRFFDRFDTNSDDVIDEAELKALAEGGLRGSSGGGQGNSGGGDGGGGDGGGGQDGPPAQSGQGSTQGGNDASTERSGRGRGGPGGRSTRPESTQDDADDSDASAEESSQDETASQDDDASDDASSENEAADEPSEDDGVSGNYNGNFISDQLPPDAGAFTMSIQMDAENKLTGSYDSERGGGPLSGTYNPETQELKFSADNEFATLVFQGKIENNKIAGFIDINDGAFEIDFEATRTGVESQEETEEVVVAAGDSIKDLVPGPRWVSSVEASKHESGRCYITLDGHRSNDDEPYVFATENNGKSWRSIRANLPTSAGSTRVISEDVENPNVLYLGCEFSAWVSIDRGQSWMQLNTNLPTVAIHEFAVHPIAGEIVAATHGRSLWILDVSILRQVSNDTLQAKSHLYEPKTAVRWRSSPASAASSTRRFVGDNPSTGVQLAYSLGEEAQSVSLRIRNLEGEVIREFETTTDAGLHVVRWNLQQQSQNGGRGGRGGGRGFGRGRTVPTGTYLVQLEVDGETQQSPLNVVVDPDYPEAAAFEDAAALQELLLDEQDDEEEEQSSESSDFDKIR